MALAYKMNDKYQAFLLLVIMMRMVVVVSLGRGKISSILRLNINYRKRCSTHTQCKITSSQFCTAGQIALDDSGVYIALGPRAEDSDPSPLLPGRPSPYPPHIVGYILPTSHSHLFLTMDRSYSKS